MCGSWRLSRLRDCHSTSTPSKWNFLDLQCIDLCIHRLEIGWQGDHQNGTNLGLTSKDREICSNANDHSNLAWKKYEQISKRVEQLDRAYAEKRVRRLDNGSGCDRAVFIWCSRKIKSMNTLGRRNNAKRMKSETSDSVTIELFCSI